MTAKELNNITDKIEHFCFTWFNFHFLNTDKEFVNFLKEKGGNGNNILCE
jgi:hemerythrin